MELIWVLAVCGGLSWGGCGMRHHIPMPSKEACFEALAAVRFDETASGESRRSAVAYCYPAPPTPPAPTEGE